MTAPKKQKKDPYKLFLRITVALAVVSLISLGVFLACNAWVDSDYRAIVEDIHQQNIDNEQAFNVELEALRASAAQAEPTGETTIVDLPTWEATIEATNWRIEDEGKAGLENTYTITVSNSSLCEGGLMLVNGWHPVPDFFSTDNLISIGAQSRFKIPVQDATVTIFPSAYTALEAMYNDATAAGMTDYIVREAFRTNETQTQYFTDRMDSLSSKYSGNILIEEAKKTVNYPGTSEFQSGLSFRLGLYNREDPAVAKQKFQETDQGKWITENSWKYGIIFRFPSDNYPNSQWEDKSYKTGVSVHLDLYRYVGKAHAAAMKILDMCQEEYMEFLIDHPHISIYENDVLRYEIVRINITDQDAYVLPVTSISSEYQASIDNLGAAVMAYTYGF
ncbi:MAG TPA: M15 family metallopeptidase [Candidatus Limiplasma sp.]|nr:M15 family metallopeptidase [Candidatus Limiplasma sp.]HRX07766.1 M15 family metallopeptidase [Candidatus Limiplasma sp.]